MAQNKLALYNVACRALGERSLASLTEERPVRRLLDDVYDAGDGAVKALLEHGLWNFAMRAVQIDKSNSVEPEFGFSNAFDVPTDFVRLDMISAGEFFNFPLDRYEKEGAYFYSDVDPLYLRYVSDDSSYGGDQSAWPESFLLWAGTWMAVQISGSLKSDTDIERLMKRERRLLVEAKNRDASQEPTRFRPPGFWLRARGGGRSRWDRGKRSSLTG